MRAILALWQLNAAHILVDFSELRTKGPLDVERFSSLMTLACEKGEEKMMSSWYSKVINLFSGEQSLVGKLPYSRVKMESFHDSVSTLLGNQVSMKTQTVGVVSDQCSLTVAVICCNI